MVKKIIAIVALLFLITITIVQAIDRQDKQSPPITKETEQLGGLTIGSKAPNFTLHSLDGDRSYFIRL